jgi:Ca2+-binding RTX toxin-like protein
MMEDGATFFDGRGFTFSNWTQGTAAIYGTPSDETIYGSPTGEVINAGGGADVVRGGGGDDSIISDGNQGPDIMSGGTGIDQALVVRTSATIDLRIDISQGGLGKDIGDGTKLTDFELVGAHTGSGNDRLIGADLNDILDGGAGDDVLKGGDGWDEFRAGDGNDTVNSASLTGHCKYDGGAGTDLLILTRTGAVEDIAFDLDTASSDIGDGSQLTATFEQLNFKGGSGDDAVSGRNLSDTVNGGDGNDVLNGRGGDDKLKGGTGKDDITGANGRDVMTGGGGGDNFIFAALSHSAVGANRDVIQDFQQGSDILDLASIPGLTFSDTGSFSGQAGEIIAFQTASRTVVAIDADGNRTADMEIGLAGLFTLTGAEFLL